MTRNSLRPLAALAFVSAVLLYVGCSSKTDPAQDTAVVVNAPDAAPAAEAAPAKQAEKGKATTKTNWSTGPRALPNRPEPRAVILISGEQDGYLEPCGCTEGQLGGLLRRYVLAEKIREAKWPLAAVDLGSLMKDPAGSRGGFEEAKIKFQIAQKALTVVGYDAVALSADDLKVGIDEALAQSLNTLEKHRTRLVSANVTAPGFEAVLVPSVQVKAGDTAIGVTAVTDPESIKKLSDPAKDLLQVKPIDEALPGVLAELEKSSKVQVLLVQASPAEAKELARKHPGFDVVVSTSPFADPPDHAEKLNGGKTLLIQVGKKGKYAGLVGIFDDKAQPIQYSRVTLGPKFDGAPEAMKKVVQDEFRGMLKAAGIVENFPRRAFINAPKGATFAGVETCKTCHPNTFAKWATTKHARGFESLVNDPKPNTIYDAECVSCHTTGFEYLSGWKSPEATPHLKGNQCENCHGPGSLHNADPDNPAYRKALALKAEDAERNRLCSRCHDEDNSPKFEFKNYWSQVVHKKLDTYDDPKVHKPLEQKLVRQDKDR